MYDICDTVYTAVCKMQWSTWSDIAGENHFVYDTLYVTLICRKLTNINQNKMDASLMCDCCFNPWIKIYYTTLIYNTVEDWLTAKFGARVIQKESVFLLNSYKFVVIHDEYGRRVNWSDKGSTNKKPCTDTKVKCKEFLDDFYFIAHSFSKQFIRRNVSNWTNGKVCRCRKHFRKKTSFDLLSSHIYIYKIRKIPIDGIFPSFKYLAYWHCERNTNYSMRKLSNFKANFRSIVRSFIQSIDRSIDPSVLFECCQSWCGNRAHFFSFLFDFFSLSCVCKYILEPNKETWFTLKCKLSDTTQSFSISRLY